MKQDVLRFGVSTVCISVVSELDDPKRHLNAPPGSGVIVWQWAREHSCWTRDQWASELFSDESRPEMMAANHVGDAKESATVVTRRPFGGGGVTVCAGV